MTQWLRASRAWSRVVRGRRSQQTNSMKFNGRRRTFPGPNQAWHQNYCRSAAISICMLVHWMDPSRRCKKEGPSSLTSSAFTCASCLGHQSRYVRSVVFFRLGSATNVCVFVEIEIVDYNIITNSNWLNREISVVLWTAHSAEWNKKRNRTLTKLASGAEGYAPIYI